MEDFFGEEFQKHSKQNNDYENVPPAPVKSGKSNKQVRSIFVVILMVAVFVLGLMLGNVMGESTNDFVILEDVLNEFKNGSIYYNEATWEQTKQEMIATAGTYMLQTKDSYGFLLTPAEYYTLMYPLDSGTSATYGISFLPIEKVGYYVTSVSYGSGAYQSGIQVGDLVLLVNRDGFEQVSVATASSEEVNEILGGSWNTTATFTLLRGLDSIAVAGSSLNVLDISVTKVPYENNFVDYYFGSLNTDVEDSIIDKLSLKELDGTNIGYIKLNGFDATYDDSGREVTSSSLQFASAMNMFKEAYGGKGTLVLDLSDNPGGSVAEAAAIASYLIYDFDNPTAKNYLVTTLESSSQVLTYNTDGNYFADYFDETAAQTTPQIVVITNGSSASASELLLGCMLDYGTAVHVGETSYGKGIAQSVKPLANHTQLVEVPLSYGGTQLVNSCYAIYYTTNMWYSPVSHTNIHGVGYVPQASNLVSTKNTLQLMTRVKVLLDN